MGCRRFSSVRTPDARSDRNSLTAIRSIRRVILSVLEPPIVLSLTVGLMVLCCSTAGPENEIPRVQILEPRANETIWAEDVVEIVVEASDPDGEIRSVSCWADDQYLGSKAAPPHTWSWNTSERSSIWSRITVVAEDDAGATATDALSIQVAWKYRTPEAGPDGWETASLESVSMDPDTLEALVALLRGQPNHRIHGILIARHGKLVFEKYFDGLTHPTWGEQAVSFDAGTTHLLSSVTKSFTTTLLGVAIQQGMIEGVDEYVMDFFPEYPDLRSEERIQMTLEDLATMRSGLAWDEWTLPLTDPGNDLTAFIAVAMNGGDAVRYVLEKPMVSDPGKGFVYSGGNANVLGEIIGRAAGMRLDTFAREYLFEPLGISDFWFWVFPTGLVYASGDLGLRHRDMLKLGQMYLDEGAWKGQRILPADWAARSAHPYTTFSPGEGQTGVVGYGYGWWVRDNTHGTGAFAAQGWGGQEILVLPEHDMVVALTGGSYWEAATFPTHTLVHEFILPAVVGPTPAF